MKKILTVVTLLIGTICVTPVYAQYNPNVYSRGLQAQNVILGKVIAVRPVQGRGGNTMGRVAGGIAGAALGNRAGHGVGKTLATAAGALVGAFAGGRVQQSMTTRSAMDVTVKLNNGRAIAVVENHQHFHIGQQVQVMQSGNRVRVLPLR